MQGARHTVEFAYDNPCAYAYLALLQVEGVAYECRALIIWMPPHGKSGSATDAMPLAKRRVIAQDLQIQVKHVGAPFFKNAKHPLRTVTALRLILCAEKEDRPSITHALFRAYWVQNLDVSDTGVLEKVAHGFGIRLDATEREERKQQLHENTVRLANLGAFGVPCFIVNSRLYWGQDRLVLVEKVLSSTAVPRHLLRGSRKHKPHTLVFYYDFSSPWSFLASLQVESIAKDTGARLVWKPFLLGALFKEIKTPIVPLLSLHGSKASYARKDIEDWSKFHNANLKYPTIFPIISVLALRVAIVDCRVVRTIYHAAWVEDKDISKAAVLHEVLRRAGFDSDMLLGKANKQDTKQRLRDLTAEVLNLGACGAPTFLVLDPDGRQVGMLWGQDRLNVVADMLCGWHPHIEGIQRWNEEVKSLARL
ncbi:hypothetical protein KP509_36G008800 [Ceratopteris richardii]|uniref:DSBA-like thioredoxin domain-containing protein n=1 Tax=Ceratopteris richardii TaxID=49495 RepID=A0A8T2QAN7_CERRI|nr:hypothetical protein KP509_36G008800 [Ceratopteris richardii]